MEKVYLKHGAQDADGKPLDSRQEYLLKEKLKTHSVLSVGYKTYVVNNKYIKFKPRS
ncbi:hypothetical protein [Thomasclavelia cocleata]|uniref:hypothetical protein n=1 Tax=Thomasclavelia cocleata TaxID=69824 RepID=UPI00272B32FC|nr:hypothetical protein [Thomasclavelia cocleata]